MVENSEKKEPLNKNNKVPKLRFKGFKKSWKKEQLKEISAPIKEKNSSNRISLVISNSAVHGLISQTDFFDKDIANNENINRYYVIHKGDFVYNPRKSIYAPYGPINVLEEYNEGIVSPLYICFKIDEAYTLFLKWYFKTTKWHRYIYINGDQGARGDRVSIKEWTFYKMPIYLPSDLEIDKIASFLELVQQKIIILERKINILKKYKKGVIKDLIKNAKKSVDLLDLVYPCEKTGLLSSDGKSQGKYKFFINSSNEETKWVDDYIFDGEYLILNTGGSAYTNYINGKFSAMSDCLVLKLLSHSISLYYWLKFEESRINQKGFQGTGLRHLDVNWLLRQKVKLIEYDSQKLYALNDDLNCLIRMNELMLAKLNKLKAFFLNNMFI